MAFENISSADGAKLICTSPHEDLNAIGFDTENAKGLGLKLGDNVAVTPTDNGKEQSPAIMTLTHPLPCV